MQPIKLAWGHSQSHHPTPSQRQAQDAWRESVSRRALVLHAAILNYHACLTWPLPCLRTLTSASYIGPKGQRIKAREGLLCVRVIGSELGQSGQTIAGRSPPLSALANTGHRDKLFWTSVVIPTTCRCHHSACACAVSGAVMPVPWGLTTVYPLIDRTCSRVKPWPELPSCTSQLLPPTWLISTNT